eukprot:TRINITY_DN8155_c0_g1_i1.p1 TRINITY_DN8155_c0_g1~~TRINITY_DN8155_c0_g1_i1.p1  ORF type:complete len:152 (-),score=13.28 TRINITY_DN8155_c0_g1_i1:538-993(-)
MAHQGPCLHTASIERCRGDEVVEDTSFSPPASSEAVPPLQNWRSAMLTPDQTPSRPVRSRTAMLATVPQRSRTAMLLLTDEDESSPEDHLFYKRKVQSQRTAMLPCDCDSDSVNTGSTGSDASRQDSLYGKIHRSLKGFISSNTVSRVSQA